MIPIDDDDDFGVRSNPKESGENPDVELDLPSTQEQATWMEPVVCNEQTQKNGDEPERRRNPTRERKRPGYLDDYVCGFEGDVTSIDYCYRLVCGVPQTYKEAVTSVNGN